MTETMMTEVTTDDTVTTEPIIIVSAQIIAPEIAAQQAAFQAENPDLFVMTVADYNKALKEVIVEAQEEFLGREHIPASVARYEQEVSYVTNEGIGVTITVLFDGFEGAHATGPLLVGDIIRLTDTMVRHLVTDPLSEHRREHVAELMEFEYELNQGYPDFDEAAALDKYNHAPLGSLCTMSLAHKAKALPDILTGFYPGSDSSFVVTDTRVFDLDPDFELGSFDPEPRPTGLWARVRNFFAS